MKKLIEEIVKGLGKGPRPIELMYAKVGDERHLQELRLFRYENFTNLWVSYVLTREVDENEAELGEVSEMH